MKNTKKNLKLNLIIAFVFLAIFFVVNIVILYAIYADHDTRHARDVALFMLSGVVVILFSALFSSHYAKAYKKSILVYLKRMWGQIIIITLFGFALTLLITFAIEPIILPLLDQMSSPIFILTKLPFFAAFIALTYAFISKTGYIHAKKGTFNLDFHIVSVIAAFILIIPMAVKDSMFPVVNPHAVFALNRSGVGESLNLPLMIVILLATLIAEICVLILAYMKGKQKYINKRSEDSVFETDEI